MTLTVQFSRVVVGVSSETSAGILRTAAEIARSFRAELAGLYIEDETLIGIADLPFSTETAFAGASRPYRRADVEQAFRNASANLQHRIETAARAAHLKHTFVRQRGAVANIVAQIARVGDIVVFVEPERAIERACVVTTHYLAAALASSGAVLYVPRGAAAWPGGVVAVLDGAADNAVLAAAMRVAADHGAALTVLSTGETATRDLAADTARGLGIAPPDLSVRDVRPDEIPALIQPPGELGDCLVVIARNAGAVSSPHDLRALAGVRRAPVLLIEPERSVA